ncbi:hypothetical protein L218DRAFT_1000180 [Marasmius fiardii PR-910]|nr:hypothetical protein L218DRAFT_1000180 [Marasmius fiardii PR-910]
MGNSQSSSASVTVNKSPQHAPQLKGSRSGTASPAPAESKSFRSHRKKSIDLPDLQDNNPYKDKSLSGMKSAPLPIPVSDERIARKVNQADYAVQPSSHMDHFRQRNGGTGTGGQPTAPTRGRSLKGQGGDPPSRVPSRGRGSQYMHYIPSNLSSATFQRPGAPPPSRNHSPIPSPLILDANVTTGSPEGVTGSDGLDEGEGPQEIFVKSSIPLGFYPTEDPFSTLVDGAGSDGDAHVVVQELDVVQGLDGDEVLIKISWHGEGQTAFLVVESDNTWNGRKQMDLETSPQPQGFLISSPVSPPASAPTSAPTSPPTEGTPAHINVFSTTLSLRPDTHHLRFLVDDEWRVADNLPTAVDNTGALANYVIVGTLPHRSEAGSNDSLPTKPRLALLTRTIVPAVTAGASTNSTVTPNTATAPPTPGSPSLPHSASITHGHRHGLSLGTTPAGNTHIHPAAAHLGRHNKTGFGLGFSFWSASSSNDMEAVEVVDEKVRSVSDHNGRRRRSPPPPVQMPIGKVHYTPQWTTEIPLELTEAAQEEEKFLEHQTQVRAQMQNRGHHQTQHVSGFIPLPNIPPAPKLPRHLEKLILNSTGAHTRGGGNSASGHGERDGRRRDKDRDKDKRSLVPTPIHSNNSSATPLPVTTASGTNVTNAVNVHHSTHRTHHHRHTLPASDRDAPPPPPLSGHPPVTAVTAVAISTTTGSSQRISTSEDNAALIADDCSVLPVPSHVVLHHLTTSAIKHGVLAVAQTGRYRKKFVTTVYYKPT